MKNFWKGWGLYLLIFSIVLLGVYMSKEGDIARANPAYSYQTLIQKLENGEITRLEIQSDYDNAGAGRVTAYMSDNNDIISVYAPSKDSFMSHVDSAMKTNPNLQVVTKEPVKTISWISILPTMAMLVLAVFLLVLIMQQVNGGGGGGRVMSFGKSKAKVNVDETKKVMFKDVAGVDEEKEELSELVDFLKTPKKFVDLGARIPKGVLLVGPPGTGKTLLAKAVAGEAGAPFFSISGSDFVEMFVGVGASRVRDLFEQAKKSAPCIIFIDEIDAVGRRRGAGLGGGHDEREQTLNQLLVEMDGFGENEGVIVLAATNRADILDPALLRPGRFDRRVVVAKPDVKGREEILNVHAKGKPFAKDVSMKVVAQTTSGFTGADLENLLNEAALLTARVNKKFIDMEEIRRAFVKVGIGTEKKSRVIPKRERMITAYHEAGHGIIQELMPYLDRVHSISIIQTGMAAGYTMSLPSNDNVHYTKNRMLQEVVSLLGGRAAEYLIINDITSGASSDIERATAIVRSMVMKYGMSETLGPIQFGDDNNEVFIGRDLAHARNYGEEIASTIDKEIKKIIDNAYEQALQLVKNNLDIAHKCADLLIEKEKITGEEFRALFPAGVLEEIQQQHINIYGEDYDETLVDSGSKDNADEQISIEV